MVYAGDLFPAFFPTLRSSSLRREYAATAQETVGAPEPMVVYPWTGLPGQMGVYDQGESALRSPSVWRPCRAPLSRRLRSPGSPRSLPPKYGEGGVHVDSPSPADTRWPQATPTAAQWAVGIR